MQCLADAGLTFIFHCLILDGLCSFPRVCVKVCDHVKGILYHEGVLDITANILDIIAQLFGGTFILIVASCLC